MQILDSSRVEGQCGMRWRRARGIGSLLGLLLTIQSTAWGATYYVRADGTAPDKWAATGCSSAASAMSVVTHNWQGYQPGDTIVLCSEGGVYRTNLGVQQDGAPGAPFTYDGRGTAVVSGAELVGGWVSMASNLYRANVGTEPQQVFVDGVFGNRKPGLSLVTHERDWFWQSGQLYLYSQAGDPDQVFHSPGVEAGARTFCIDLQGHSHVRITGIIARHSNSNGIGAWNPGSDVRIDNCIGEWNWNNGIGFNGNSLYGSIVVENNVVRYNGTGGIGFLGPGRDSTIRRNACYENGVYQSAEYEFEYQHRWTYGIKLWEGTALQEGNRIYENESYANGRGLPGDYQGRGAGIWIDMVRGNPANPIFIHHNLVYDNKGNGVFIEISSNTVTYGNVIADNASNVAGSNKIFAPANIVIDARGEWHTENNLVYNNTLVGGRLGIKVVSYEQTSGCSIRDNVVKNNIVVGASEHNLYCNTGGDNVGPYGSGNVYLYNNFGEEDTGFIAWTGAAQHTYTQWEQVYGQSSHSIEGDPMLQGSPPFELYLTPASPCRDTAANLGPAYNDALMEQSIWVEDVQITDQDFHGAGWDVGAFVYSGTTAVVFTDDFDTGDASRWSLVIH